MEASGRGRGTIALGLGSPTPQRGDLARIADTREEASTEGEVSPRGLVVVEAAELVRMIDTAVRRALDARSEPRADGEWIDTRAAAELLGVSTRQIAKLAAGGRGRPARLSSSRVGRLLRFRRADVLAMLEGGA